MMGNTMSGEDIALEKCANVISISTPWSVHVAWIWTLRIQYENIATNGREWHWRHVYLFIWQFKWIRLGVTSDRRKAVCQIHLLLFKLLKVIYEWMMEIEVVAMEIPK